MAEKKRLIWKFKEDKNDAQRQIVYNKLFDKHPGMVFVVVQLDDTLQRKVDESGTQFCSYFIIDPNSNLALLQSEVRKRIKIGSSDTMIMFMGEKQGLATQSEMMGGISKRFGDVDGFLYVIAAGENSFG